MKERPILFSGAMVKALLAGTKTQTRRIVSKLPCQCGHFEPLEMCATLPEGWPTFGASGRWWCACCTSRDDIVKCPYGKDGDRLWVRETWAMSSGDNRDEKNGEGRCAVYRASWTDTVLDGLWKPSIFMPRWASRITLKIADIRIERLQDITEHAAWAEGITPLVDALHTRPLQTLGNLCIEFPKTNLGRLAADDPSLFHFGDNPQLRTDYEKVVATSGRGCFAYLWESINGPGSWAKNPWVWVIKFNREENA